MKLITKAGLLFDGSRLLKSRYFSQSPDYFFHQRQALHRFLDIMPKTHPDTLIQAKLVTRN